MSAGQPTPYVREVGRVEGDNGEALSIGVDHDSVAIFAGAWLSADGATLTRGQAEEFGSLFAAACWAAGENARRMSEEAAEAVTVQAEDYAQAESDRAERLVVLANEILGKFVRTSDGYRARAGQVQIRNWEAALLQLKEPGP